MNIENTVLKKENIDSISQGIRSIEERVGNLKEAAQVDMEPKVERLKIMEEALLHDVNEVNRDSGADRGTVVQLYHQLNEETNSLKMGMEALSLGNPTTVTTAAETVFRGVDKVAEKVSEVKDEIKDAYQKGLDSTNDES